MKVLPNGGKAPKGWIKTTPWDVYKVSFNGVDLFNKGLRRFAWPFAHRGQHGLAAEGNISDFIEAVTLKNTVNAWTSLSEERENWSDYKILYSLSDQLYALARNELNEQ